MNFEPIIWGSVTSAVPSLVHLFTIYFILSVLRTFFTDYHRD